MTVCQCCGQSIEVEAVAELFADAHLLDCCDFAAALARIQRCSSVEPVHLVLALKYDRIGAQMLARYGITLRHSLPTRIGHACATAIIADAQDEIEPSAAFVELMQHSEAAAIGEGRDTVTVDHVVAALCAHPRLWRPALQSPAWAWCLNGAADDGAPPTDVPHVVDTRHRFRHPRATETGHVVSAVDRSSPLAVTDDPFQLRLQTCEEAELADAEGYTGLGNAGLGYADTNAGDGRFVQHTPLSSFDARTRHARREAATPANNPNDVDLAKMSATATCRATDPPCDVPDIERRLLQIEKSLDVLVSAVTLLTKTGLAGSANTNTSRGTGSTATRSSGARASGNISTETRTRRDRVNADLARQDRFSLQPERARTGIRRRQRTSERLFARYRQRTRSLLHQARAAQRRGLANRSRSRQSAWQATTKAAIEGRVERRDSRHDTASAARFQQPAATEPPFDENAAGTSGEKRFYLKVDDPIVEAPSIGERTAERLISCGIHTVGDLLAADPGETAERINARHITVARIEDWQFQARLVCTVPWLRGTHAQLLVGAGYTSPIDITEAEPETLCADVPTFAATRDGQRILRQGSPPEMEKIRKWAEFAAEAELDRAA